MGAFKGVIRGNTIEMEDALGLPDGTKVEVEITESSLRGRPQSVLQYWQLKPVCTKEDVDALLKEIDRGKKQVRFEGIFDKE